MDRVIAARTDFTVVDERDEWLVADKPAPLIVHPTNGKDEPTLVGELRRWLEDRGEPAGTLSIINRLDRETSGLVLVARTPTVARALGKAMMRRQIAKSYQAIVSGWPAWDTLRVDAPLRRIGEVTESAVWLKQGVHPEGRPAVTHLRVLRRFERPEGRFSLLGVETETGRTHQIRVHCASAGHPLVGDKIYGPDDRCYLEFLAQGWTPRLAGILLLPRQALHAGRLELEWEGRALRWETPPPDDLLAFLPAGGNGLQG